MESYVIIPKASWQWRRVADTKSYWKLQPLTKTYGKLLTLTKTDGNLRKKIRKVTDMTLTKTTESYWLWRKLTESYWLLRKTWCLLYNTNLQSTNSFQKWSCQKLSNHNFRKIIVSESYAYGTEHYACYTLHWKVWNSSIVTSCACENLQTPTPVLLLLLLYVVLCSENVLASKSVRWRFKKCSSY